MFCVFYRSDSSSGSEVSSINRVVDGSIRAASLLTQGTAQSAAHGLLNNSPEHLDIGAEAIFSGKSVSKSEVGSRMKD